MNDQRKIGAQVAVLGGGIMGCASAYYLARRGVKVVLLEKSDIGREASGHNSGGVRQQCRDPQERPLAMASVKLWEQLDEELCFDTEYFQGGNIRMAINEERMDALRREGEEELAAGLPIEIWDHDELQRRAPYLNDVFVGAKYCRTDGHANPLIAARAFGWAAERAGATLLTHTEACDISIQGGRVTAVIGRGKRWRGGCRDAVCDSCLRALDTVTQPSDRDRDACEASSPRHRRHTTRAAVLCGIYPGGPVRDQTSEDRRER